MTKDLDTNSLGDARSLDQRSNDFISVLPKSSKSSNDLFFPLDATTEKKNSLRSSESPKIDRTPESNGENYDRKHHSAAPYDRLVRALHSDQRAKWELAYGRRIGFYSLKGDIGSGNFSKVKVAMHALTRERVAIKILDKTKMDAKTKKLLSGEIASMEMLHHPNIIKLYEVIHTNSKLYLVMEYACGGELFKRLSSQGKMTEGDAKIIFSQILSAVEHMHLHKVIHRDLKAENVFYSEKRMVKVGDFGFSTKAHGSDDALDTFCGSPPYAAPELFRDAFYYGEHVDVWALGILLYFTVTGTLPFRAETVGKLKRKILQGQFSVPSHVSRDCSHLIRHILKPDPSHRLPIRGIKQSSWLNGVPSPIPNSYLKLNPGQVVVGEAQPEEAYALYMMDKLGIKEKEINGLSVDAANTKESFVSEHNDLKTRSANSREPDSVVDLKSAIVGTYRIFLHRAYQKLTYSSQEEVKKMSTITSHINGSNGLLSRGQRQCADCSSIARGMDDAAGKKESMAPIASGPGVTAQKKTKRGASGNSGQTGKSAVKSKFCTLL